MKQKFSTQPSEDGLYEVVRWNEFLCKWEPMIKKFPTKRETDIQVAELNRAYNEELGI